MAIVYSLICWGGRVGNSVSVSASTDLATLANHGLRDGSKLWPSGSLPAELNVLTPVYARSVSANTFSLHPTAADAVAGTNQILFAGSSSYSVTFKSSVVAEPAVALAFAGLSDLSRWYDDDLGVYRIYNGLAAWNTGRSGASKLDIEVCEIGEAWDDWLANQVTINVPAGAIRVETKVNGVRSAGFHNGQISNGTTNYGYVARRTNYSDAAIVVSSVSTTLDGFTVMRDAGGYGPTGITAGAFKTRIINMIVRSLSNSGIGINTPGVGSETINCLVMGWGDGFYLSGYSEGILIANCTAVKNSSRGFNCITYQPVYAYIYNCVALGNTTENWQTTLSGLRYATNNAGGTGQAWMAGTGASRIEITEASPFTATFADYTNNDFTPKDASSQLVDAGAEYYGAYAFDLADDVRPSYENGITTYYDVGAFEFDHGYGPYPQTQPVSITDIVEGSRIKIAKQSDHTELYNAIISGSTSLNYTENVTTLTPVDIYVRKGSAVPYYYPLQLSAQIDPVSGLALSLAGLQQEDIAAADYSGGNVATDWAFNSVSGAITHTSGVTRYSVRDLYSWHEDYIDDAATVSNAVLMRGITPTIYTLLGSGTIADVDLTFLFGGSIEFPDGTLWSNLWTTATMAAAHSLYIVQGGNKLTPFWSAGPIDILLKVRNAGVLIDSGFVTVYAREYGYSFAEYAIDLSAGGRNVAPLATVADAVCQSIDPSAFSDVAYTWGAVSLDLGEGGGAGTYYCRIDCNFRPLSQVFARTMYDCRDTSSTVLNGVAGWKYTKAHASYTANTAYPFGLYSGGVWKVAQGVWLDNVATVDQYNFILTDDSGATHQKTLPAGAATASVLDGTRVVLFNDTQDVEIDNVYVSGTSAYSYIITTEANTNDVLRLYAFKEGYEEASASMIWSGNTQSFVISQTSHPYINALRTELGISDYTTITEFTPDTTGHIYIEANDVDGISQKARLAIWYNGILTTAGGARYFRGGMSILSTAVFRVNASVVDILLENVNMAVPLRFLDVQRRLYRDDGSTIIAPTSYSLHNDYNGVPDVVETGVSGLTGAESSQLMSLPTSAAFLAAAAASGGIAANVTHMNSVEVIGDGSPANKIRTVMAP